MNLPPISRRQAVLGLLVSLFAGCTGSSDPAGNLPATADPPAGQTEIDRKKMEEMMGGMYKGAPGAPVPKSR